ncbi:PAS-domain containing protein, partial [Lactiplantibacillus plantarum]|nr:PAS-domain containing protein [Lactiplantibacillus plantarum]
FQVQRATLDKLNDAVAVFGSDGRLRLHNEAFETFWSLSAERIATASDFDALAELCKAVLPDPALWLGLKARVADPDPESRVAISGEGRTVDGRVAAWQTRPLPDGATLVAFSDVTARRGLEQALVQREQALAESQAERIAALLADQPALTLLLEPSGRAVATWGAAPPALSVPV